jgi:hypothetical protein
MRLMGNTQKIRKMMRKKLNNQVLPDSQRMMTLKSQMMRTMIMMP